VIYMLHRPANKRRVLLSGVFGPYGVNDAYGRKENPMELFHNQVTRAQGIASWRYHHESYGLYFIAENVNCPVTVLDFPSEKRFIKELKSNDYDLVGISFIVANVSKAKRMAELTRKYAPKAEIVIGGFGTAIEGIEHIIDCDYVVRGEGIRWLREYLGEDTNRPIFHPTLRAVTRKRIYGIPLHGETGFIVPGVGCPYACPFCSTSHFFGKSYLSFYEGGEELFNICCRISKELNTDQFFIMDENFFIQKKRALELLSAMEREKRFFTFTIFSSTDVIAAFGIDNMLRLGIDGVWIGVESKRPIFHKTKSVDIPKMIKELRNAGIGVLTSVILGLDHHDKKTVEEEIDYIISLRPDFSQFAPCMALPVTGLYEEKKSQGLIDFDLPYEEWHGQKYINWRHPHLSRDELYFWLKEAFKREYDRLGASIIRMAQTMLNGYRYLEGKESDPLLALRRKKMKERCLLYRILLPTMRRFAHNEAERNLVAEVEKEYKECFGPPNLKTRIMGRVVKALALLYYLRLKFRQDITQPRTRCTRYHW